ncbi:MAG: PQQ-binding-like beta-propeller repeat protein [Acidobacteriota bacterium]
MSYTRSSRPKAPTPLVLGPAELRIPAVLVAAALSASILLLPAAPAGAADDVEASAAAPTQDAATWPQWRGPSRDGKVPGNDWPTDLKGLEQVWRLGDLGPSYSGPIVTADTVFTTETIDKTYEKVTAYDRATGELRWQKQWPGAMKVPFFAAANGSWIRSTPVWDDETGTLFVGGIREVVVALDGATGKELWRVDFPKSFESAMPPFGFVCSPMVTGDHLYVEAGESMFKLDKRTGETVWRAGPFTDGEMGETGSFSSPVLATVAGREQLLVQSRTHLRGLDPADGGVLWAQEVPSFRGMNILTPAPWGDGIFTSTYKNASYFFRVEPTSDPAKPFAVELAWQSKPQAYMSSPVLLDGAAYLHLGNGRLTALDLANGEQHWTSKPFGKYWSMAVQGNRILALDNGGELILIEADPAELKILDRRSIADAETWAHVAVSGDEVVVRELHGLSVWRWGTTPEG